RGRAGGSGRASAGLAWPQPSMISGRRLGLTLSLDLVEADRPVDDVYVDGAGAPLTELEQEAAEGLADLCIDRAQRLAGAALTGDPDGADGVDDLVLPREHHLTLQGTPREGLHALGRDVAQGVGAQVVEGD